MAMGGNHIEGLTPSCVFLLLHRVLGLFYSPKTGTLFAPLGTSCVGFLLPCAARLVLLASCKESVSDCSAVPPSPPFAVVSCPSMRSGSNCTPPLLCTTLEIPTRWLSLLTLVALSSSHHRPATCPLVWRNPPPPRQPGDVYSFLFMCDCFFLLCVCVCVCVSL